MDDALKRRSDKKIVQNGRERKSPPRQKVLTQLRREAFGVALEKRVPVVLPGGRRALPFGPDSLSSKIQLASYGRMSYLASRVQSNVPSEKFLRASHAITRFICAYHSPRWLPAANRRRDAVTLRSPAARFLCARCASRNYWLMAA